MKTKPRQGKQTQDQYAAFARKQARKEFLGQSHQRCGGAHQGGLPVRAKRRLLEEQR